MRAVRTKPKPLTKKQIEQLENAAWKRGVQRCIDRLDREGRSSTYSDVHYAAGMFCAGEILERLLRRGR